MAHRKTALEQIGKERSFTIQLNFSIQNYFLSSSTQTQIDRESCESLPQLQKHKTTLVGLLSGARLTVRQTNSRKSNDTFPFIWNIIFCYNF